MKLALTSLFLSFHVLAKTPKNADLYTCPDAAHSKPIFLHETNSGPVLSGCGLTDAKSKFLLTNFNIYAYSSSQKKPESIFSNTKKDQKFILLETPKGVALIETYSADKLELELFKHIVICSQMSCKQEKEVCIYPKFKAKKIQGRIKNNEIISRMKKLGCL